VILRNKRQQVTGERPWSVSGISQLGGCTPQAESQPLAHFSISESALHQMVTAMPPTGKCGSGVNLSSSVDEATLLAADCSGSRNGSLRRRKVRLRKRTLVSNVTEILYRYYCRLYNMFNIFFTGKRIM
jgi:hypothetical protein